MKNRIDNGKRRGSILLITGVSLVFVVPMIGLSIDCGILYAVKTKLSGACDAGALAGARALSRGNDDTTQQNNAKSTAKSYIKMDFPNGYFGVPQPTPPDPTIDETVSNQRSVSVTATVNVPTYFMRWLGFTTVPITANATATRRDVNVMIVMDRSKSLQDSGSCAPLIADAITFVGKFANGRDNVGLVTFASSTLIAPGDATHYDFKLATNFQTAATNVPAILNNLVCNGGTNTAQGLYMGYVGLEQLAQPNALNVLVMFTDGQPTEFHAVFPIKNSSPCNAHGSTIEGVLGSNGSSPWGLNGWQASAQPFSNDYLITPNSTNCTYASSWYNNATRVGTDVTYIPASDAYGNAMNTNYQTVTYYDGNGNIQIDANGTNENNAAFNAADSMALRIRHGASLAGFSGISGVRVYTIGLGNAPGGVSDDFLERVANDPGASNFDSSYPQGTYYYAPTSADINAAFSNVAAEILRLAK